MEFRIGVNLGDVMVEGYQIYGDGINVAARLESLADPGGIYISGTVHEQVRDKLALGYQDSGEQTVKNIARPVRVCRVLLDGSATPRPRPRRAPRKYWQAGVFSFAGLAIIASTIVIVQHLSLRPQPTQASIPLPSPAAVPIVQPSALPFPDKPSIAVLPFANVSGDPAQEYFSDGITDQIITDLSKLPGLFVIDRNSAFTYKGKMIKVQEVSREWECGLYWKAVRARRLMECGSQCSWWMRRRAPIFGLSASTGRCATSLPCRTRSCKRS